MLKPEELTPGKWYLAKVLTEWLFKFKGLRVTPTYKTVCYSEIYSVGNGRIGKSDESTYRGGECSSFIEIRESFAPEFWPEYDKKFILPGLIDESMQIY
jgi:hypothetical protein